MRTLFGNILFVCLLIAALQGILAVLAVGLILALLVSAIVSPVETFGIVALLLVLRALELWPLPTTAVMMALLGIVFVAHVKKRGAEAVGRPVVLLPPPAAADRDR
jgi:membrane-bound ClpP family serine protease